MSEQEQKQEVSVNNITNDVKEIVDSVSSEGTTINDSSSSKIRKSTESREDDKKRSKKENNYSRQKYVNTPN